MTVVVWIVEGTWTWCVDAAREWARDEDEVVLLHVVPGDVDAATTGALAGLLGRGRSRPAPQDPPSVTAEGAGALLAEAAERLGGPAETRARTGRVEREVVAAAAGADLLVVARDGDRSRLGPRSLGHHTRFVVDHAPCPVLLVWPGDVPAVEDIPPPPEHPPDHPPHQPPHRPPHRHLPHRRG